MVRNINALVLPASSGTNEALLVAGLTAAERTQRALAATGIGTYPPRTPDSVVMILTSDALLEPAAVAALVAAAAPECAAISAGDDPASPAALALSAAEVVANQLTVAEQLATLAATLR